MKARHKRLLLVSAGLAVLATAAWLVLSAFQQDLIFFFTPTQIAAGAAPGNHRFRVGGLVEPGSLERQPDGLMVSFVVTDMAQHVRVNYRGILPDLFMEGKGVVVQGRLGSDGTFTADEVLAKHDENYMPPEAAHALKEAGARPRVGTGSGAAARGAP
jgi:cytochrome c-type biogenesis protein CcmE